jgi:hypothetical protein
MFVERTVRNANTLTVQNAEVVMLNLVVHLVTTDVETAKHCLLEI